MAKSSADKSEKELGFPSHPVLSPSFLNLLAILGNNEVSHSLF
jgi:hypothetical protein